jgi:hypothetical protein
MNFVAIDFETAEYPGKGPYSGIVLYISNRVDQMMYMIIT